METNTPSMNDAQRLVDHAAAQSDRWLFIASLVILLLFAVYMGRYMMQQHAKLEVMSSSDRSAFAQALQANALAYATKLTEVTSALQRASDKIEENTKALEKL